MLKRVNKAADIARPPGPTGIPFLGNLFEARRDPLRFVRNLSQNYGDVVSYRVGVYDGYLINHPEHIQHILQTNHKNYSKEIYNYEILKLVIGEGLITSTGDHWLRQRRLVQPAFHRKRLSDFGSIMTTAAVQLLDSIASLPQPIDMSVVMSRLTLQIIGKVLFSVDTNSAADRIGTAFTFLNEDIAYRLNMVFVPPSWVPTPRNIAFKKARAQLDDVVYDIIASRQKNREPKGDLLDMLLNAQDEASGEGMSDRLVRDEVLTLMLAGHETTANALTWTWYLLSKHPAVAQKLRDELDDVLGGRVPTVDDLSALEYTEKVILEVMRLYPPIWIIARNAIEDDEIGQYVVPSGTDVMLSPYAMHRHPDFWKHPKEFDPERFSPERARERHRYAYFPFGGGPRHCIGENLAMMETQLILATMVQKCRFELVPGHPVEPEPLITLRPRYGVKMTVQSRPQPSV